MSIKIRKHPAERFIDWFPNHTRLYVRGERSVKTWEDRQKIDGELFRALVPFMDEMVADATKDLQSRLSLLESLAGELVGALGPDAAGREFGDLLREAARDMMMRGGGPLADCLRLKSDEVDAALAAAERAGIR